MSKGCFYKGLLTIFLLLGFRFTFACSPFGVPNLISQNIVGNNLELLWESTTPWSCTYWVTVEIVCQGQPFTGNNTFTSPTLNKPNNSPATYPSAQLIDISTLCPGGTYSFRARECSNGSFTNCGNYTATFTFTVPGVSLPMTLTASASPTVICFPATSTLLANVTGACGSVSYSWDQGLPATAGPHVVSPSVTTTYTVTATDNCNGATQTTSVTVSSASNPTPGTAAVVPDPVCLGDSVTLYLVNYTGAIQWQSGPSGGVGPWTDIVGAITEPYGFNNVTSDMCFRAELTGCVSLIYSNVVCVTVSPPATASFTHTNICYGTPMPFTDTSPGAVSWNWDFGDGVGTSILQNPSYTYTSGGNYNVQLTVTNASGCTKDTTISVTVISKPTAAFSFNNACFGSTVGFTDLSNPNGGVINSWQWDFDNNGIIDNTNQNPSNLYPSNGTYNAQLIVSTGSGCDDTIMQAVDIYPLPVADFTFVNACFGTAIAFTDNSAVVSGSITNWNWSFGNSNTSIIQNPSENYGAEGVYNVRLIITTNNGCLDTINKQIEVWPIPIANFSPAEACLNNATLFSDLSTVSSVNTINNIVQWNWDFNGQGSSTNQNPTFTFNTEGIMPTTLIVTSNNGCSNTITLNVTVNPLPQIIFGDPTVGCAPNMCVTFVNNSLISSGSIASWQWDFGDGSSSTSTNPSHCYQNNSYSVPMNFDVSLTGFSDKQCSTSETITQMITAYPKPYADFGYTPLNADIYDMKITFYDKSIIANSWSWDFGDGFGSSSIESDPIHIYPDSGFYLVTLTIENIYGCKDTTAKPVRINPAFGIWVPNVFTPDGDGINDYFFATAFGMKEMHTMIFDRWGLLLFEGNSLNSKWNGTYKGKKGIEDMYVYRIQALDLFNHWHEYTGKVTILK